MRRDFLIKIGSQVWLRMAVDCVYFGPQHFSILLDKITQVIFYSAPTSFTPPRAPKSHRGPNLDIASWQQLTLQISRVIPDFTRKQANIFARLWSLCHWVSKRKECNTGCCWGVVFLIFVSLGAYGLKHGFCCLSPRSNTSEVFVWSFTSQEPSKKCMENARSLWQSCLARPALQWYFIVAVVGGDRSNWEIDMIFIYIYNYLPIELGEHEDYLVGHPTQLCGLLLVEPKKMQLQEAPII